MSAKNDKKSSIDIICGNCLASDGSAGTPKLSACSRCGLVAYCSKDCQRAHWKANHKHHCVAKADRFPQKVQVADDHVNVPSKAAPIDDECSICLETLTEASSCSLPCTHKYHKSCVTELRKFGMKQVCPLCRTILPSGPSKSSEEGLLLYMQVARQVELGKASWSCLPAAAQRTLDAAITRWRSAAREGCSEAQSYLGSVFENGLGVAQNDVKAAQWHRKSADQGNVNSLYKLATFSRDGLGVAKSVEKAAKLFRKAADQEHLGGQLCLAIAYAQGCGVAQSDVEAVRWYRKAADQGNARAQSTLALHYSAGMGIGKNIAEALKWWRKAANQGEVQAQYKLAFCLMEGRGVAQNYEEAAQWFKKAAEQGYTKAERALGDIFAFGRGVVQSDKEAVRWFRKAADKDNAEAIFCLGVMYDRGRGVAQNYKEALRLFKKAASLGHAEVQRRCATYTAPS